METTQYAAKQTGILSAPNTARPAPQQCVVPVAPACFLLQASAGSSIDALSYSVHQIAKTYHAFGAANVTFIISDAQALNVAGFFTPAHQRVLVGGLPIELHYMFATEQGVRHSNGSSRTLSYWAEYFFKARGTLMLRLAKTCGIWLLSVLILITPSVLRAIGAIKD